MRNYELIKEIYEICQTADYRDEGHVVPEIIFNLIEKERPEFRKNFWEGGYIKKNHWPQQDAGIDY